MSTCVWHVFFVGQQTQFGEIGFEKNTRVTALYPNPYSKKRERMCEVSNGVFPKKHPHPLRKKEKRENCVSAGNLQGENKTPKARTLCLPNKH